MRKEKIVDLGNDEKVILLEMRVSDIWEYKQLLSDKMEKGIVELISTLGVDFVTRFTNLRPERVARLSFSEIELLENAFKDLNAPLFRYSERLGVKELLGRIYKMAIKEILENLEKIISSVTSQIANKIDEEPLEIEGKSQQQQEAEQQS